MRLRNVWTMLPLLLVGCQTPSFTILTPEIKGDVEKQIEKAVCDNLVPIASSKADTPLTRRQIVQQNARVNQCPPELRRKPDLG